MSAPVIALPKPWPDLEAELIVMVQGDEPMTRPEMIDAAIEPFRHDPELGCVNLVRCYRQQGGLLRCQHH